MHADLYGDFAGGPLVIERCGVPAPDGDRWREMHNEDCPTLHGEPYCICGTLSEKPAPADIMSITREFVTGR